MSYRLKKDLPSKETLAADLDRMEEALTKLGSPSVFSHNDLLLKNIVYNKAKGRDKVSLYLEMLDNENGCGKVLEMS